MTAEALMGVYREAVFSPGKVADDAGILDAALSLLSQTSSYAPRAVTVEELKRHTEPPKMVLSMAQSHEALTLLENWRRQGTRVINTPQSVRNCYRAALTGLLQAAAIPMPTSRIVPLQAASQAADFNRCEAYWIKRGDVHAMQTGDVTKVASVDEINARERHYRRHGINEVLVQEHVHGVVVKFYAAADGYFFQAYANNGAAVNPSVRQRLETIAARAAKAADLEIYGGDAVVAPDGDIWLIDLNDWPSFGRCRPAAAQGIARYINHAILNKS